jgi:hypothetical protein
MGFWQAIADVDSILGDLEPSVSSSYISHPDFLDAWVARRKDMALEALERTSSVR